MRGETSEEAIDRLLGGKMSQTARGDEMKFCVGRCLFYLSADDCEELGEVFMSLARRLRDDAARGGHCGL